MKDQKAKGVEPPTPPAKFDQYRNIIAPVGALLGAMLGFFASFAVTTYTNIHNDAKEVELANTEIEATYLRTALAFRWLNDFYDNIDNSQSDNDGLQMVSDLTKASREGSEREAKLLDDAWSVAARSRSRSRVLFEIFLARLQTARRWADVDAGRFDSKSKAGKLKGLLDIKATLNEMPGLRNSDLRELRDATDDLEEELEQDIKAADVVIPDGMFYEGPSRHPMKGPKKKPLKYTPYSPRTSVQKPAQ